MTSLLWPCVFVAVSIFSLVVLFYMVTVLAD